MRIAQVSPLYESVPPATYGGTERVVSYLSEELVRQGHEVTVFASGDSRTAARLVPVCPKSLRLAEGCVDQLAHHILMLELVAREAHLFDLVHFHIDYLHFPLSRRLSLPRLTTLHGRLDLPDLPALYRCFSDEPVVSISDAQRRPLPFANWVRTIYHGLPEGLYRLHPEAGDYLAFCGRISPEKRTDRAIEIAEAAGLPLRIAGKVDRVDREYFSEVIEPMLERPGVEYIGEIGDSEKDDFLGGARALLFPIDWPEPFGLTMIEAMACGTPVIAFPHGSVSEVLEDGVTGFLVESVEEAVEAVGRLGELSRDRCRAEFEERFSVRRMAEEYLGVYGRLAEGLREDREPVLMPAAGWDALRDTGNGGRV